MAALPARSRSGSPESSFVAAVPGQRPGSPVMRTFAWAPGSAEAAQRRYSGQMPEHDRPLVHAASVDLHDRRRSPSPSGLANGLAVSPRYGGNAAALPRAGSYGGINGAPASTYQFGSMAPQVNGLTPTLGPSSHYRFPRTASVEQFSGSHVESPSRRQTQSGESIVRNASPRKPPTQEAMDLSATCRRLQNKLGGLNGDVLDIVHL